MKCTVVNYIIEKIFYKYTLNIRSNCFAPARNFRVVAKLKHVKSRISLFPAKFDLKIIRYNCLWNVKYYDNMNIYIYIFSKIVSSMLRSFRLKYHARSRNLSLNFYSIEILQFPPSPLIYQLLFESRYPYTHISIIHSMNDFLKHLTLIFLETLLSMLKKVHAHTMEKCWRSDAMHMHGSLRAR